MSAKVSYQGIGSGSAGILFTDRRKFYINENTVNELYQDVTPFTTLLGSLGSVAISDPVFKLFEYRNGWLDQYVTVGDQNGAEFSTPAVDSSGSTFDIVVGKATPGLGRYTEGVSNWNNRELNTPTFSDAAIGLLLQYKNGSNLITVRVQSVNGATLSVAKVGVIGTVDTIAYTEKIYVVGSAFAEGTEAPEAAGDDITTIWGRTQIMKTAIEVTGTLYHQALRGYSNELARLRQEKMKEHKILKEKTYLLGYDPLLTNHSGQDTFKDTQNGLRYTLGVIPALMLYGTAWDSANPMSKKYGQFTFVDDANVTDSNTTTTYGEFIGMMENMFAFFPTAENSRILLCGSGVINYFNQIDKNTSFFGKNFGNGGFQLTEAVKSEYGFNVRTLHTPFGSLMLAHAPILRGDWRDYGVVLDLDYVKEYVFRGTAYTTNVKVDNAYDGVKDQIMTDSGVGVSLIERHALINISRVDTTVRS